MDSSVLISALDGSMLKVRDMLAKQVFEQIIEKGCTLCIATPALAECLLGGHECLLGLPRVELIEFDAKSSRVMVNLLGHRCANLPEGSNRKIAKFDAMIAAAYLVRGRVGAFITGDNPQSEMARKIGLNTISLQEVLKAEDPQLVLEGV